MVMKRLPDITWQTKNGPRHYYDNSKMKDEESGSSFISPKGEVDVVSTSALKAKELWDETRCWIPCSCGKCVVCKAQKARIQKALDEAKKKQFDIDQKRLLEHGVAIHEADGKRVLEIIDEWLEEPMVLTSDLIKMIKKEFNGKNKSNKKPTH